MVRPVLRTLSLSLLVIAGTAFGAPPDWLKKLAAAPLPSQPPDVAAVQLLDEVELAVAPDGNMSKRVRSAVRILRKEGQARARAQAAQNSWSTVKEMRGWLIP